MTFAATNYPTLTDWAKRLDPDLQSIANVAELLNQNNEILQDLVILEGNNILGNRSTIRTGLPPSYWRLLNQAVPAGHSTTAQVDDSCGSLEAWGILDKALYDLNSNGAQFRLTEAMAQIESLNQAMAQALIYGDTSVNPERFLGLASRFNSKNGAPSGANIIDAGGAGSTNCSIWLAFWGPMTGYGFFPKGSQAGLVHEMEGPVTSETSSGLMKVYRDHYVWKLGLTIRDWRFFARIANIDVSLLTDTAASGANIINQMIHALYRIPSTQMGKGVWYVNRTIKQFLHTQAMAKASSQLTLEQIDGKPILMFAGFPVRLCDQLINTEARVV